MYGSRMLQRLICTALLDKDTFDANVKAYLLVPDTAAQSPRIDSVCVSA